jgi:hypothetical protein
MHGFTFPGWMTNIVGWSKEGISVALANEAPRPGLIVVEHSSSFLSEESVDVVKLCIDKF